MHASSGVKNMNPKMKNAWDNIPLRIKNGPLQRASNSQESTPITCTQNLVMTGSTAAPSTGGGSGRKVLHDYHDHGHIAYNSEVEKNLHVESRNNNHRGKVPSSFPEKLHLMLSEVEGSGLTDIVSW